MLKKIMHEAVNDSGFILEKSSDNTDFFIKESTNGIEHWHYSTIPKDFFNLVLRNKFSQRDILII